MTDPSPDKPDSDQGFLLRIAGKALSISSVAALVLPTIAMVHDGGTAPYLYGALAGLAGSGVLGAVSSAFANAAQDRPADESKGILGFQNPGWRKTGFMGGFLALDLMDGKPGPVVAALFLAAAATAVAVPTYLSGKSVYDNFIRKASPAPAA
jgi:hypothetical protein